MQRKASIFAICLLLLLAISSSVEAAPIFSDGFETNNFTAWSGNLISGGNTVEVVSTDPHHGTYNAHFIVVDTTNWALEYKTYAAMTTVFSRMYVKFVSFPASTYSYDIIMHFGSDEISGCRIVNVAGTIKWRLAYVSGGSLLTTDLATPNPSLGVWYCVEVTSVIHASSGSHALYIDGTKQLEVTGLDTDNRGSSTKTYIGYQTSGGRGAGEMHIDCVVVDLAYIGPEVSPDTTKPTYALINSSTIIPAQICIFSCNWTDETGLSGYIFGTNNTGTWINETWITLTSWANVTKTLNATDEYTVQFEWWANDTSNNWNNTGVQSITLTSTDVLPYLAMGGILGGTGVMAIFLIRKRRE